MSSSKIELTKISIIVRPISVYIPRESICVPTKSKACCIGIIISLNVLKLNNKLCVTKFNVMIISLSSNKLLGNQHVKLFP